MLDLKYLSKNYLMYINNYFVIKMGDVIWLPSRVFINIYLNITLDASS